MKKILILITVLIIAISTIACGNKPPQPIPTQKPKAQITTEPTVEPTNTPEPPEEAGDIFRWDSSTASTNVIFDAIDLDADGANDVVSYTNDPETTRCELRINDAVTALEFSTPTQATAIRFSGKSYFDVFISGDMCSDDYVTYQLCYVDGEVEVVKMFSAYLYRAELDCVEFMYAVNMFGTWEALMRFAVGGDGTILSFPVSASDACLHTFDDESTDYERALTTLVDIPTIDGGIIPAGIKVLPKTFNYADETVEFIDAAGTAYIVEYEPNEDLCTYRCGGIPEEEAFENLFYAD